LYDTGTKKEWHDSIHRRIYMDFDLSGYDTEGDWGSGEVRLSISPGQTDATLGDPEDCQFVLVDATKSLSATWADSDYNSLGSTILAGPFSIASAVAPASFPDYTEYNVSLTAAGIAHVNSKLGSRCPMALVSYEFDWLGNEPELVESGRSSGFGPYTSTSGTEWRGHYICWLRHSDTSYRPRLKLIC
jgi:hypothetical protein